MTSSEISRLARSAWVKLSKADQTGAVFARMDDAHDYRGWDLWIENGMVGSHVIHAWDGKDALKVVSKSRLKPNSWNHLAVTYDGSSKAKGLKIYVNGELQKTSTGSDNLKNTIRTEVPFRVAQRNNGSRLNDALDSRPARLRSAALGSRNQASGRGHASRVARLEGQG